MKLFFRSPFAIGIVLLCLVTFSAFSQTEIERYALYIGANDGGSAREKLHFAASDACSVADTMHELGGVKKEHEILLIDPTVKQVQQSLSLISKQIESDNGATKREEFIFYYSGHSDEDGLLLGESKYLYSDLKQSLADVPGDVHVVVLDSCYSGNFMRSKGGTKQKPFLVDDSTIVSGHAYLSSSSATEQSQESDSIGGSFFTKSLVTGLRGAADSSGDKKVSLNELYYYAFNNTLSATEKSKIGPQHPGYNVTLVGSGDMVLTDLGSAEAVLVLSKEVAGDVLIRTSEGTLASETMKKAGVELVLALPAGTYEATVVGEKETKDSYFILTKGIVYTLDEKGLATVSYTGGRSRGPKKPIIDGDEIFTVSDFSTSDAYAANTFFKLSLAYPMQFPVMPIYPVNISCNLISGIDAGISGIQLNGITGLIKGTLNGVQMSGISGTIRGAATGCQMNGILSLLSGNFTGIQTSGIASILSGEMKGIQLSGIFNHADNLNGVQIGLINHVHVLNGVSIGLFNFIDNGIHVGSVYFDSDGMLSVQYQGGTSLLFTTASIGKCIIPSWSNYKYTASFGIGSSLSWNTVVVSGEVLSKIMYDSDLSTFPEIRGTVSVYPFKHIGISAGASVYFNFINDSESIFHPTCFGGVSIR